MLAIDVIIPVFNEGGNIENTLDSLDKNIRSVPSNLAHFSIDIVYDFDEDNTLPALIKIENKYSFSILRVKNEKRGVLNAIKCGLSKASGDYCIVTMADLSDDYSNLPEMVALAQKGYDIVCPSRYMKNGKLNGGPFLKQLFSRIAGVSLYHLVGFPTHDITNSYKMYKKSVLNSIILESEGGFEIGMEITAKIYINGGKIVEIPTQWWDRTEGKSRFKLLKWLPRYLKWYFYVLSHKRKNDSVSAD